jgi:hypothetical protein
MKQKETAAAVIEVRSRKMLSGETDLLLPVCRLSETHSSFSLFISYLTSSTRL